MEAKKNPYHYDPKMYVQGSTVRKLEKIERTEVKPLPNTRTGREPLRREPERKYQPAHVPGRSERQRIQENAQARGIFYIGRGMGFFGMLIVAAAVFAMVWFCVGYLELRAESTRLDKTIASLETELAMAMEANRAMENSISEDINLENIYQTAVAELGMVFPNKNEVIYYSPACVEYVRQYQSIP